MQGFDEDYKDAKRIVIVGGILYLLGKILPQWLIDLLGGLFSLLFFIVLGFAAIAAWRMNVYGTLWDILSPIFGAGFYLVKAICFYGPVNLACIAFNGTACLALPPI